MCNQLVVLFPSSERNFFLYFAFADFFQMHLNVSAYFWCTFMHFIYYWKEQLFFFQSIQFLFFFFLCACVCPFQTGQLLFLYAHFPVLFILVNWPSAVGHTRASWKETICMAQTIISSIILSKQTLSSSAFGPLYFTVFIINEKCLHAENSLSCVFQTCKEFMKIPDTFSISNHILFLFSWKISLLCVTYRW